MIHRRMPSQLRAATGRDTGAGGVMPPAWTEEAPCSRIDPNLFFPEQGVPSSPSSAKRLCRTECPVRQQCLEWALSFERDHPSRMFGIYGGMTPRERKALLRSAGR